MLVMFGACEKRQCVNVTIVDDFEDELNEIFIYTLEGGPGVTSDIRLNPSAGVIEIVDNDGQYLN